jgi:hypothetical protein
MWEDAGLLGQCGRELCRRVAGELERAAAQAAAGTAAMGQAPAGTGAEGEAAAGTEAAGSPVAAQVVLVDASGERMIGMYGRLRG